MPARVRSVVASLVSVPITTTDRQTVAAVAAIAVVTVIVTIASMSRWRSARRFIASTRTIRTGQPGLYAVTGAEAGLGLATTAALVEAGATVVMGVQDVQKGRAIADKINGVTKQTSAIMLGDISLNMGDACSIDKWSQALLDRLHKDGERLEALVHQAGVMGLGKYTTTTDGHEMQWAINFVGPFRLTQRLWDVLVKDSTRILCRTSASHCTPDAPLDWARSETEYHGWRAYQQSVLASLLFSNELNRRLADIGAHATSHAVAESDKWYIHPKLLLPDDRAELASGPTTTLAVLGGVGTGGEYLIRGAVGTPGTHGTCKADARRLWEATMNELAQN